MKILFCISIALCLPIQLALGGATATATLPLVNGDFETGPYNSVGTVTGWTVSGNGKIDSTVQGATSGTHSAALSVGGNSQGNVLSQTFFTTPGRVYSLDFDAGIFGNPGNSMQLHVQVIGNSNLLDHTFAPSGVVTFNPDRTVFGHYHYTFVADAAVTTLQFADIGASNAVADIQLDTVSVVQHVTNGLPMYTLTDLGTLGGTAASAAGINTYGQVTGSATVTGDSASRAFLSAPGSGPLKDLGALGGGYSNGLGVNTSGQVTGGDSSSHGFLSAPNGGALTDLGTLGGDYSEADAVNVSGQVAGISNLTGNSVYHAFLSGPNGGAPLHDLGTLGGTRSFGNGVNASGQVCGRSYLSGDGESRAFLSGPNGGPLTDLGTLGGGYSSANGVNDSGQVAGAGFTNIASHVFLSGPNGRNLTDLGPLGARISGGDGINSCGQVAGSYYLDATDTYYAFIYTSTGGIRDLNMLISPAAGFHLREANGINDQGQIAGTGYYNNNSGVSRAFLLTPKLSIERTDSNNVTLFWPGSCTGPNVQQASALAPTTSWGAVTTQPTVVDGAYSFSVSTSADNSPHFYRLTFLTGKETQAELTAHPNKRGISRPEQPRSPKN